MGELIQFLPGETSPLGEISSRANLEDIPCNRNCITRMYAHLPDWSGRGLEQQGEAPHHLLLQPGSPWSGEAQGALFCWSTPLPVQTRSTVHCCKRVSLSGDIFQVHNWKIFLLKGAFLLVTPSMSSKSLQICFKDHELWANTTQQNSSTIYHLTATRKPHLSLRTISLAPAFATRICHEPLACLRSFTAWDFVKCKPTHMQSSFLSIPYKSYQQTKHLKPHITTLFPIPSSFLFCHTIPSLNSNSILKQFRFLTPPCLPNFGKLFQNFIPLILLMSSINLFISNLYPLDLVLVLPCNFYGFSPPLRPRMIL